MAPARASLAWAAAWVTASAAAAVLGAWEAAPAAECSRTRSVLTWFSCRQVRKQCGALGHHRRHARHVTLVHNVADTVEPQAIAVHTCGARGRGQRCATDGCVNNARTALGRVRVAPRERASRLVRSCACASRLRASTVGMYLCDLLFSSRAVASRDSGYSPLPSRPSCPLPSDGGGTTSGSARRPRAGQAHRRG